MVTMFTLYGLWRSRVKEIISLLFVTLITKGVEEESCQQYRIDSEYDKYDYLVEVLIKSTFLISYIFKKSYLYNIMKRKLISLIVIVSLTTTAWANISTKQLETYMKVSGTNAFFEKAQQEIIFSIEMKFKRSSKKLPTELLKKMKVIVSKKENLEKFTKRIKVLDEKAYTQIIKFYKTKLGQKGLEQIKHLDMLKIQKEMKAFSKKKLSKDRELLISKLVKVSMSKKRTENMKKITMQVTLDAMPKKIREEMKKKMDRQFVQMKPMIEKEAKFTTSYEYKDYSNEELKSLIEHYETTSAQAETEAIIDGTTEYFKAVMSQIMKELKKVTTVHAKGTFYNSPIE